MSLTVPTGSYISNVNYKHGDTGKRLHNLWRDMLKRCNPDNNPNATKRYAARGIYVCDEWSTYSTFKNWAEANGYTDELSIDRVDNNGPYAPWNCQWTTKKEQCRNRRTTANLTLGGRTQCVAAWLEERGVTSSAYYCRIARGWSAERALNMELTC